MADKKKQHYVPQFYMRHFIDSDKKFHLFNVNEGKYIGLIPYKDQCYEDYFYGKDKVWEDKLSVLEGKWETTFNSIILGDYSVEYINNIKEFTVFQIGRTKTEVERQIISMAKLNEEYLISSLEGNGMLTEKSKEIAKEQALKKATDSMTPSKLLDLFSNICDEIDDLSFLHIINKTKIGFISSDNPILCFNSFNNNIGFGMNGLVMMFPISSNDLVVLFDGKIYPKYANQDSLEILNEYIVKKINALSYANAFEIVFSKSPFDKYIYSYNLVKLRNNNLDMNGTSSMGNYVNKIIAVHRKGLKFDFSFSFLKIESEFNSIKCDYRTPVPRKYNEGYKKKLFEEYTVIPNLLARNKTKEINDFYINEYRIYHEKYYKLMTKYWNVSNDGN